MAARRSAAKIEFIGVATEGSRVPVHPGDGAAALVDHREQVAVGLSDVREIDHNEIGARLHERFGIDGELARPPSAPAATVNEDHDRGVRTLGLVDVDLLDLGRPVGLALRVSEDRARNLVVVRTPLVDVFGVEGVDRLIVGLVDVLLGPCRAIPEAPYSAPAAPAGSAAPGDGVAERMTFLHRVLPDWPSG